MEPRPIVHLLSLADIFSLSKEYWSSIWQNKCIRSFTKWFSYDIGVNYLLRHIDIPSDFDADRPTVLCLARNLFLKDIEELRNHTNINYISIDTIKIFSLQRAWLPSALTNQAKYVLHEHKYIDARRKADMLCIKFLNKLSNICPIDAILSANIDYAQDESIKNACNKLSIPFLVLSKENSMTRRSEKHTMNWYKDINYKFEGEAVAVFSERHKRALVASGACFEEKVVVTGPPRFDAWKSVDLGSYNRSSIVLLSFLNGYGARDEFLDCLYVFAEISKDAASDRFFVKCKSQKDRDNISDLLVGYSHRLHLAVDEPLYELLPMAKLIVGFNSTAMLEALHTKAELVLPHWGNIEDKVGDLMISPSDPRVRQEFYFAYSIEDLRRRLESASSAKGEKFHYKGNMNVRYQLIYNYFHEPTQGSFSAEVEEFIMAHVGLDSEKSGRV